METIDPEGLSKPFNPQSPLAKKLILVMGEVSHIPKKGHNSVQNYDYATEADVVAAVRVALIKHGVCLIPSLKEKSYTPIVSKQGANGFLVSVTMTYTLVDSDTGFSDTFDMPGDGMDYGDKGIYKAMTGAEKYALLKLLHLPTGDDPEKDSHDLANQNAPGITETKIPYQGLAGSVIANPSVSQAPSERMPWTVPNTPSNQKYKHQGKPIVGMTLAELSDLHLSGFLKEYQEKINGNPASPFNQEWEETVRAIEEEIDYRRKDLVLR